MTSQVFDTQGTTSFQFTFVDKSAIKKRNWKEWNVFFSQGFISIHDYSKETRIKVNFPAEDHWTYEERESEFRSGGITRGAEIKNAHFTFTVDVREYIDSDDPAFDPECDEEGENEGWLELETQIGHITIMIPYSWPLFLSSSWLALPSWRGSVVF